MDGFQIQDLDFFRYSLISKLHCKPIFVVEPVDNLVFWSWAELMMIWSARIDEYSPDWEKYRCKAKKSDADTDDISTPRLESEARTPSPLFEVQILNRLHCKLQHIND